MSYARPQYPVQEEELVPFSVMRRRGLQAAGDSDAPMNLSVRDQYRTESGRGSSHQGGMNVSPTWAHVAAAQPVNRSVYNDDRCTGNEGYGYYSVPGSSYIPRPRASYD